MAIDGLVRAFRLLADTKTVLDIESRREIVAANLNGGLALQNGPGITQAVSNALRAATGKDLDEGIVSCALLPAMLRFNAGAAKNKIQLLKQFLAISPGDNLADYFGSKLTNLSLPRRLSEIGIAAGDLLTAAPIAVEGLSISKCPRQVKDHDVLSMMQEVW